MKNILFPVALILAGFSTQAQTNIPSSEVQIKAAVLAAPAEKQEQATVLGYNPQGDLVVLRKGTNEMICLADDPNKDGFSAACYHRDLNPFMARGRALKKAGKTSEEIFDTREKEAKSGKLPMPKQPSALYVFSAPEENYNRTTGEVKNGYLRYVVYIPYATAESTGLPLKPETAGMPWIMHPGTHGAHIMISPPMDKAAQ
ncbi:hypothetical protein I2I11_06020 [Pontibacter sp. 172403-2]|uniref:hypothetical protein n=1 Tax=Pontibacter rufus TaxID=2791028 RepID=UPI0018AF9BFC|nr:hypothetical protein [Pontibacter sp. 172403-2]MBF9252838.1 hypothetical protein [Pontibacter sp. 172403-2]